MAAEFKAHRRRRSSTLRTLRRSSAGSCATGCRRRCTRPVPAGDGCIAAGERGKVKAAAEARRPGNGVKFKFGGRHAAVRQVGDLGVSRHRGCLGVARLPASANIAFRRDTGQDARLPAGSLGDENGPSRDGHIRLLKNSVQRASLRLNRGLAEDKVTHRSGDWSGDLLSDNPVLHVQGVFQQPVMTRSGRVGT